MPQNHATLEHGLASAAQFQIAVDEPEKQQNDDKRDIAVCRGIPELRTVSEGIWKTDKTSSNTYNTVQNVRIICERHAYWVACETRKTSCEAR
jgi:hypothetical protein